MVKVIAGKYRSRVLTTLEGLNTRPMTSRMKESIFNTIGPYFDNDVVLDLFGGSGALSIEAISRGASFAYINEKAYDALRVIKKNIESIGIQNDVLIMNLDYKVALKKLSSEGKKFDIVFLDPPYRMNIVGEIVDYIESNDMLENNAIVICQYVTGNFKPSDTSILKVIKNFTYASSEVCIFQKNG